ncbi:MAG: DUF2752 domain-containing protein [Bacteroidetes bacterium]|nr:MAG: DUF2752 domain-containing protein [Bacteroidota bacterium]
MLEAIIQWLEKYLIPCQYKQLFGFSCPACGSQSALILLLRGNLVESFYAFPALIPLLITLLMSIIYFFTKNLTLVKPIKMMLILNLVIIVVSWIVKLIM